MQISTHDSIAMAHKDAVQRVHVTSKSFFCSVMDCGLHCTIMRDATSVLCWASPAACVSSASYHIASHRRHSSVHSAFNVSRSPPRCLWETLPATLHHHHTASRIRLNWTGLLSTDGSHVHILFLVSLPIARLTVRSSSLEVWTGDRWIQIVQMKNAHELEP